MTQREPTLIENVIILIFIALYYFLNDYITSYFLSVQAKILGGENQILTSPGFFTYRLIGLVVSMFIFVICCFIFDKSEERRTKISYIVVIILLTISIFTCLLSVNVFFKDKIIKYGIRNPVGKTYEYKDINNVTLSVSSGRKMGVSIEYILHMSDGEAINMAGNTARFYDCFKVKKYHTQ